MSWYIKTSFLQTMQLSDLIVRKKKKKKKLRSIYLFKAFPLYSNILAFFLENNNHDGRYLVHRLRHLFLTNSVSPFSQILLIIVGIFYCDVLPSFLRFFKLKNEKYWNRAKQ